MSVQPGLRGRNDLRVGRKMATIQLFFQSSRAKDLSAPLTFSAKAHKAVHTLHRRCAVKLPAVGSLAARRAITFLALPACPNFRDPKIAVAKNTNTPVIKREPRRLTPQSAATCVSYLRNYPEKACPGLAFY